MGDPPPDPATAPLEIILEGCQLNRPDVAPGRHPVSVVGTGSVEVRDTSGAVVLALDGGGAGTLESTEQTYTIECTTSEAESTTELESTAR